MESLDTIFFEAREMSDPGQRAAYLAKACGGDTALLAKVEAMLRDAEGAEDFFKEYPLRPTDAQKTVELPKLSETEGSVIGRYKLLQWIGEGGMGVVYMAEQREPVVRKVALKIIKLGMDSKQVVARFEAERQALALMDHPNIAKVFDGGVTETGRPYFVMELVQGMPITEFCDEANLPMRERLDLFLDVCSAVQHAHQKGIIHRDLKPSNILVTLHGDKPVPKVIDFGVAKATQGRLTDKTVFTEFRQFIGTPAYMSPEQTSLSGLDVDTRSDIYALGVLLYELLTGKTPFDAKELLKAGLDHMRQIIREQEPLKPSTRLGTMQGADLTTAAKRRRTEPPKLIYLVRGDLDWIVMKCLEKDRARRYETANGLALDLRRHLGNEPVVARPPSMGYKFQKSVQRNKLAIAATVAIITVLALGVALVPFKRMELITQDWRTRIGAKTPMDDRLVLIGIDEKSFTSRFSDEELQREPVLKELQNPWPWSRVVWARLIEKLSDAGAKVIVLDVLFTPQSDSDEVLRRAFDKYKDRVVTGYSIGVGWAWSGADPPALIMPGPSVLTPAGTNSEVEDDRLGYANLRPDSDNTLRRASYRQTAAQASNTVPEGVILESLEARALRKFGRPDLIPPGFDARLFRYTAPANQAFKREPFGEVLSPKLWEKKYDNGKFFKDKVVLVGVFHNNLNTPFINPKPMDETEIHLQMINAALHRELLGDCPPLASLFIIAISGVIAGVLGFLVRQPGKRFLIAVGISAGYSVFAQLCFDHAGQVIPLAVPVLVLVVSNLIFLAYDFVLERSEHKS